MLSYLDPIIFPDRCDILEIVPSQRYVFPIYKNGSSSLYESGFQSVTDISNISQVDVFVRDPYERFLSGVHSYLEYTLNEDPKVDRYTALKFINEYLFLNRHYVPQFHWLLNLQRFNRGKIQLLPISQINKITDQHWHSRPVDPTLDSFFKSNNRLHFYLSIDKVLTETLVGQVVTFDTIVQTIKQIYPTVYKEIIEYSIKLCGALD